MKINLRSFLTEEKRAKIQRSPEVARFDALRAKVKAGKATPQEVGQYNQKTAWVNKLPKNVLSVSHRPATVG